MKEWLLHMMQYNARHKEYFRRSVKLVKTSLVTAGLSGQSVSYLWSCIGKRASTCKNIAGSFSVLS